MEEIESVEDIPVEQIDAFVDSFVLFNKITQKLHTAYRQLEERFDSLNLKLEETNRKLRESLKEKDQISNYLNDILESLTSGVLVVNLKGEVTLFNKAAEGIIGYPSQEAVGRLYSQVMGEEGPRESSLLYTLTTEVPLMNKEKQIKTQQGRIVPLGFSTSLVRDGDGNVLGAVEVFNDLSEIKELEEKVRRVHTLAALGSIAATVAHEIRNPLGGIAGFAALLEKDLEVNDPRRRFVGKLIEGVSSLDKIVTNLLAYARPLKLNAREVDLLGLVDETVRFFEIDTNHKNGKITISRGYEVERIDCRMDPDQFREVILNLLRNAVEAMPEGGDLGIEVYTDDGFVFLRVSDTGVGMGDDVKGKLFTPFFTTKNDGTGLGLATVSKIVDAHGGRISVESRLGEGSSFVVAIPRGF